MKFLDRSGCIKKLSGGVRCWCYGQSNCNNPQNMIKLYDAFKTNDATLLDEVIDDIETSDIDDYDEEFTTETISSIKTSTAKYVTENVKNKSTVYIFEMDDQKIATKDHTVTSPSIPIDFNDINQNLPNEQDDYDPEMEEPIKTTEILSTDDIVNETMEYTNIKDISNQNERKIRHKEIAGSGVMRLHISEILRDTIILFSFTFIIL
ncbi:unnamed protein product [Cercopithifilaria johnstoni]|uniref:Uncharacterized protein n=1 Tax=Cercopithifilaria johnstoni TaxID=2874296 RepID=A0A8J2Q4S6_9BILA|nr:unnamed protein product [Cercopithifilaria johnstoni]